MKTISGIKTVGAAVLAAVVLGAVATEAGSVGGTEFRQETAWAGETDVFHVRFEARELAGVVVAGDGDTDLDLRVYGPGGDLVAADSDLSDFCVVAFTPEREGTYRIEVENLGGVYNDYILLVN